MSFLDVIIIYFIMNTIFLCLFLLIFKFILKNKMNNISKIADNEIMKYFNAYDEEFNDKFFNNTNDDNSDIIDND